MKFIVVFLFGAFNLYAQSTFVVDNRKAKECAISLSSFASKIEYVSLETTSECLLYPSSRYYVTDEYIVAVSLFEAAYLFDRKTGRYIHQITRKGQAPGEFVVKCEDQCGLKNDILYINNDKYWEGIHIKTKKSMCKIRKPVSVYHKYNFISNPWPYQDSLFIGYVNNITGKMDVKLVVFNSEGKVLEEFPNYVTYDHVGHDKPFFHGVYYEYAGNTYFKQFQGNDTVFLLKDYSLIPHVVFDWDENQKKYQFQPFFSENQIYMSYFMETEKYIIYDCQVNGSFVPKEIYQCMYEKKTGSLQSTRKHNSGFIDDLDFLGEIHPVMATEAELVDVVPAEKWLDWKKEKSKMPININVDFDSNPIIRIVHIKS